MKYTDEDLNRIFSRTSGKCHICHKKLAFKNYGLFGEKGAWEVEHSHARANGGTNRLNNLYAAHITCNRKKGVGSTRAARTANQKKRAPYSMTARKNKKIENAFLGGALGVLVGSLFGPGPRLLGAALGALAGHQRDPDKA